MIAELSRVVESARIVGSEALRYGERYCVPAEPLLELRAAIEALDALPKPADGVCGSECRCGNHRCALPIGHQHGPFASILCSDGTDQWASPEIVATVAEVS